MSKCVNLIKNPVVEIPGINPVATLGETREDILGRSQDK